MRELFRFIPPVDRVISQVEVSPWGEGVSRELIKRAVRKAVEKLRSEIAKGLVSPKDRGEAERWVLGEVELELQRVERGSLVRVINGTGVLIHTNLGRSPLSKRALERILEVSKGYSNLEYNLSAGKRGKREEHISELLRELTGAEDGFAVNNNAGAVFLVLRALAQGREVIISRGELVEIGGSFRIPDVMAESGAILREVGTTNRTHLRDYRQALTQETALILKVHQSNYRISGFTAEVSISELAELARGHGLPLVVDLGSGLLKAELLGYLEEPFRYPEGSPASEPEVGRVLRDGADLVCLSGDKLLGGPQAGIIVGNSKLIEKIKKHPLARALRLDKLTLAALEATLRLYLEGAETAVEEIPIWRAASLPTAELNRRARLIVESVGSQSDRYSLSIEKGLSTSGGGALPTASIPSVRVAIRSKSRASVEELEESLRRNDPPIVGILENDALLLDLRTIEGEDLDIVINALKALL